MITIRAEVEKDEFINSWKESEWGESDQVQDVNAKNRITLHENNSFRYSEVEIEEPDLTRMAMPFHIHGSIKVPKKGMYLSEFSAMYNKQISNRNQRDECLDRIRFILDNLANDCGTYVKFKFMYMSDRTDLAIKGHYAIEGLYAGSFHQFAAYAHWISVRNFKPLRLYFVKI